MLNIGLKTIKISQLKIEDVEDILEQYKKNEDYNIEIQNKYTEFNDLDNS